MQSYIKQTQDHTYQVIYRGHAVPFTQYPDAVYFQKTVDQAIKDHGPDNVLEQLRELIKGL